ncbi:serine hydrolase [Rhodocytophaga aerolata]|uniref:Serine hydrolase n=1 Tax=Rhodocytophaga aerolata TaxID=455078 RepID=A0ABT8R284_9BACT|nr:serine hydrolase [Rhodocytophaga aerolata]MDO1446211.1 serine hydrolase [Rhodocytophaga aerolata]
MSTTLFAQTKPAKGKNLIEDLLKSHSELFSKVLQNPEKFEVQVLYTQINRDKNNKPSFTTYSYRTDAGQYFYPASTVKLPAVLLSLEKLNQLNVPGLIKESPLKIDSTCTKQAAVLEDSTAADGKPTLAHYIKKILLVSDNDAYNRLYEFVGQKGMHDGLHNKGFTNNRFIKRLQVGSTAEEDRCTNGFTFYNTKGEILYQQPAAYNQEEYPNQLQTTLKGSGYMQQETLIEKPMDFSALNQIALQDLHGILQALIFPEAVPQKQRFGLTEADYQFVYKYMSMFPEESKSPVYDESYYNSYGKFFLYGDTKKKIPANIRIFNKAGWAYGTLTDNAYIIDLENKIEFLLTATILVNENGIFNDNQYEYETIGKPFLANLGRVILEHEFKRKRKNKPDLSKFSIDYTQQ